MSSLIYDTLKEYGRRLDDLEAQLTKLLGRIETAPAETNQLSVVQNQIIRHVRDYWNTHKLPIQLSAISRLYTRTTKPFGGFRAVLDDLEKHNIIRRLLAGNGGTFIFPAEIYDELKPYEITAHTERGMSARSVNATEHTRRLAERARVNSITDEEANAEAYAALIGERNANANEPEPFSEHLSDETPEP